MASIKTSDVLTRLRTSYEAELTPLAGRGKVLSKAEETNIASADLRGAAAAIRDGQPGTLLTVSRVVDEAIKRATERLSVVNSPGLDAVYLSRAEIDEISKRVPDLGRRLLDAYNALRGAPPTPPPGPGTQDVITALTAWAGGNAPPVNVLSVTGRQADVEIVRTDGDRPRFRVTLEPNAPSIESAQALTPWSPIAAGVRTQVEGVLQNAFGGNPSLVAQVESVNANTGQADRLVAYRDQGQTRVARVSGQNATAVQLGAGDEPLARSLAVALTRAEGFQLAQNGGDSAQLEYQLRTGALQPQQLTRVTDPDESAVGFDPTTERFQFQSPSVWGDMAVFSTFGNDGRVRVDSFN